MDTGDAVETGAPSTVRDVISRTHRREGLALVAPERVTDFGAREFATGVWKAANLFTHYGVGDGRPLAVAVGPKAPPPDGDPGWLGTASDPLFALLGGMCLGAPVDPAPDPSAAVEAPVLVAPTTWLDRFEVSAGTTEVAYGEPPDDPAVGHFERERWSENPIEPPEPLEPERLALRVGERDITHRELVALATEVVDTNDLETVDRVRVAARVDSATRFVAGVLAPLLAGTPIRPVPDADEGDVERGVFAVAGSERHRLSVEDGT